MILCWTHCRMCLSTLVGRPPVLLPASCQPSSSTLLWCAMQYGHQPGYAPQQAAPPQMPPHQMPYASQPMYAQTAAAYPAYPQAAPAQSYYTAPAHAYPQSQMHEPPIQQPQSAAQAAMMAAIKVSRQQRASALMSCTACLFGRVFSVLMLTHVLLALTCFT